MDDQLFDMESDGVPSVSLPVVIPQGRRLNLSEILANTGPPPWTLTAFLRFLENNHCLEPLEFTMDASRYRKHYAKMINRCRGASISLRNDQCAYILMLWDRLMDSYIREDGQRTISLRADLRDAVLSHGGPVPPHPSLLDEVVAHVFDLMEKSALQRFLDSVTPESHSGPVSSISGSKCSSFATAPSSISSYTTASVGSASWRVEQSPKMSEWRTFMQSRDLLPSPMDQKDWSGRGQHVEYGKDEAGQIPLQHVALLGVGAAASVDRVRCKRITLARKTIRCSRRLKREVAITEVEHLQRLTHSHIVRVIGTYVLGNTLSILLYPATDYNLESFMDSIFEEEAEASSHEDQIVRFGVLPGFFLCLASALVHIHEKAIKHMDIKPQNLLVRDMGRNGSAGPGREFKIYVADFGIAKAYRSSAEAETDTPTSFTARYGAPEVVAQEKRGLSADVFSLGCVYTEMLAVVASIDGVDMREELQAIREANAGKEKSYQANIAEVVVWMNSLAYEHSAHMILHAQTIQMLSSSPEGRPSAADLVEAFGFLRETYSCNCEDGPDPLEADTIRPSQPI